eukprot:COSAG01_NODE_7925_length_2989_cov_14.484775_1_plen_101_part_10
MNQGQGEATRTILNVLGFENDTSSQVGTTVRGSNLFPASHLKLYKIVGGPGTGKSVVLNAVCPGIQSVYSAKVGISRQRSVMIANMQRMSPMGLGTQRLTW